MPLSYLLDEHLRGTLWNAIQRYNAQGGFPLDVARVGDPPDLPLGTLDPAILAWAERENRILVSRDEKTLGTHLADHMAAGHHSPGIFIIRPRSTRPQVIAFLAAAAYASAPVDWRDQLRYIP